MDTALDGETAQGNVIICSNHDVDDFHDNCDEGIVRIRIEFILSGGEGLQKALDFESEEERFRRLAVRSMSRRFRRSFSPRS